MKSKIKFTEYLIHELLVHKNPSEYFFYLLAKLKKKDLFPLVELERNEFLQIFCAQVLHKILQDLRDVALDVHLAQILSKSLSEDNRTILYNIIAPVYYWEKERAELIEFAGRYSTPLDINMIEKKDFIKEAVVRLENYIKHFLYNPHDLKNITFNAANRNYYWRLNSVYEK